MSKRVYEIARERDLSTKEVIEQLNDAGIEVKSNFTVVENPVYEEVFGDDPNGSSDGAAQSGRFQVQGLIEGFQSVSRLLVEDSPSLRVLVYILVALLLLAVGVGAMAAMIIETIF